MMRWHQDAVPSRTLGHRDCEATPERQARRGGTELSRPSPWAGMTRTLRVCPSSRGSPECTPSDHAHNFRKSQKSSLGFRVGGFRVGRGLALLSLKERGPTEGLS